MYKYRRLTPEDQAALVAERNGAAFLGMDRPIRNNRMLID